ncbi:uncharacterized protein yc1106_07806 [Curvularia clavata]|uniref:Uncharacterized protein n=1 Tax=Curvularia clavata TaxID=95742 RepID=A0A9Q8ZC95_CURCL|nr:uncharacterized protein yc1106_07806 [Curvularia clavata]
MACTRSRKSANPTNGTAPSPRRSLRTRKARSTTSPEHQVVRRSARLANKSLRCTQQQEITCEQSSSSSTHKDSHESKATTKETPTSKPLIAISKLYPKVFSYVDDTAFKSGSTSPSSTNGYSSSTESDFEDKTKHPSTDNMHYVASDVIDGCKEDYDNLQEAKNDEYGFDEFVVWDGEVDEEGNGEECQSDRKGSFSSTSSEDTLFIPEIKAKKRKRVDEQEPEEVAEQISDAIVLFSRRCNRDLEPVVLRATKRIRRDTEVAVVWDRALRLGLGVGTEMSDGSVVWRIGPKAVNGVL